MLLHASITDQDFSLTDNNIILGVYVRKHTWTPGFSVIKIINKTIVFHIVQQNKSLNQMTLEYIPVITYKKYILLWALEKVVFLPPANEVAGR